MKRDNGSNRTLLYNSINNLIPSLVNEYTANSHNALASVIELMQARKLNEQYQYGWAAICSKGEFELHDYGTDLLFVSVTVEMHPKGKACCRVHVGNIDDGCWQARSKIGSVAAAKKMTDEIAKKLFESPGYPYSHKGLLRVMPSAGQLNKLLSPWKIVGEFD